MTARKPANLLLVDDDPSLLKLLGMRLTSEGFHVTTAESGQEALRLLAREQIDLVISDLRMDEMDGMALFAEIQKHQPGMPVIIPHRARFDSRCGGRHPAGGVQLPHQTGGSRCAV